MDSAYIPPHRFQRLIVIVVGTVAVILVLVNLILLSYCTHHIADSLTRSNDKCPDVKQCQNGQDSEQSPGTAQDSCPMDVDKLQEMMTALTNKTASQDFLLYELLEAVGEVKVILRDYNKNDSCPPDFISDKAAGLCYKVVPADSTWANAHKVCKHVASNTRLVVLDTMPKFQAVRATLIAMNAPVGGWVNAEKNGTEWQWVTSGEKIDNQMWQKHQPDDTGDCVRLHTDASPDQSLEGSGLDDAGCDWNGPWVICEKYQ